MNIKMKLKTRKTDLALIFKIKLDEKGFSTWEEFINKIKMSNYRAFIDFFNGKQAIKENDMIKACEELEIPLELLILYVDKEIRYKIRKIGDEK